MENTTELQKQNESHEDSRTPYDSVFDIFLPHQQFLPKNDNLIGLCRTYPYILDSDDPDVIATRNILDELMQVYSSEGGSAVLEIFENPTEAYRFLTSRLLPDDLVLKKRLDRVLFQSSTNNEKINDLLPKGSGNNLAFRLNKTSDIKDLNDISLKNTNIQPFEENLEYLKKVRSWLPKEFEIPLAAQLLLDDLIYAEIRRTEILIKKHAYLNSGNLGKFFKNLSLRSQNGYQYFETQEQKSRSSVNVTLIKFARRLREKISTQLNPTTPPWYMPDHKLLEQPQLNLDTEGDRLRPIETPPSELEFAFPDVLEIADGVKMVENGIVIPHEILKIIFGEVIANEIKIGFGGVAPYILFNQPRSLAQIEVDGGSISFYAKTGTKLDRVSIQYLKRTVPSELVTKRIFDQSTKQLQDTREAESDQNGNLTPEKRFSKKLLSLKNVVNGEIKRFFFSDRKLRLLELQNRKDSELEKIDKLAPIKECSEDFKYRSLRVFWEKYRNIREIENSLTTSDRNYNSVKKLYEAFNKFLFVPVFDKEKDLFRRETIARILRVSGESLSIGKYTKEPIPSSQLLKNIQERMFKIKNGEFVPLSPTVNFAPEGIYVNAKNLNRDLLASANIPNIDLNHSKAILIPWYQILEEGFIGSTGIQIKFTKSNNGHPPYFELSIGGDQLLAIQPDDPQVLYNAYDYFRQKVSLVNRVRYK